jgi:hypothetical protein
MNTSKQETLQEALHEWLHNIPVAELPPIINEIVENYRQGNLNKKTTEEALTRYKVCLLQWADHNQNLRKLLEK